MSTAHRSRSKARVDQAAGFEPDLPVLVLAGLGLLITAYLSYGALAGSPPLFCAEGSGCDLVQQSRWSQLLGLPISLFGFGLYLLIAALAAFSPAKVKRWRRLTVLSLAGLAISVYLTLVGLIELQATCGWCLASLGLLLALCLILVLRRPAGAPGGRWRDFTGGTAIALILTLVGLHLAYGDVFTPPENPRLRALAQHLEASGARYYGAFWCPQCQEQQRLFGTAARHLPYVECSPNGRNGPLAFACVSAEIQGYPTWVIGNRRFVELIEPERLARLSGFDWQGFAATREATP